MCKQFGTDLCGNDVDNPSVHPHRLPIKSGDTISFYFRPRVQINMDSDASSGVSTQTSTSNTDVDNEENVDDQYAAKNTTLGSIFFQPRHRWISHPSTITMDLMVRSVDGGDGVLTVHKHTDGEGNVTMEGTILLLLIIIHYFSMLTFGASSVRFSCLINLIFI